MGRGGEGRGGEERGGEGRRGCTILPSSLHLPPSPPYLLQTFLTLEPHKNSHRAHSTDAEGRSTHLPSPFTLLQEGCTGPKNVQCMLCHALDIQQGMCYSAGICREGVL